MRVTLSNHFIDIEEHIAATGWSTQQRSAGTDLLDEIYSEEFIKQKAYDPKKKKFGDPAHKMLKLATSRKYGSILDFAHYIYEVEGLSRTFSHQLVRHRMAAYMQQSQRAVLIDSGRLNKEFWMVIPISMLQKGTEVICNYIKQCEESAIKYHEFINEYGIEREDARFVVPEGTKTFVNVTKNARSLQNFFEQRMCKTAQWEIQKVSAALYTLLNIVHPRIFEDMGPYCASKLAGRRCVPEVYECISEKRGETNKLKEIADERRNDFDKIEAGSLYNIDLTDVLGYKVPHEVKEEVSKKLGYDEILDLDYRVEGRIRKMPPFPENMKYKTMREKAKKDFGF